LGILTTLGTRVVMRTEILLSRGETVTSVEVPAATQVKVDWPDHKRMTITVPEGQTANSFLETFGEILHPQLLDHLIKAWPSPEKLAVGHKSAPISPWNDVQIEILAKKPDENKPGVDLDRPRITIQMGLIVDEFKQNYQNQLKPALVDHIIRLWSYPDYPREVIPQGRNILIRDSF